ncbi:hypothetical protein CANARDRAFT_26069 [[Candida] arabinofermentans NRRL YB-2248]|uniref:Uncharacterized protein n=1 Tax=[Candida] arabinofermentans NRRL YB-2248 TaxID=983967 RepID=A0A1E4T827_9ASCO|nr:hypothetical protein CANARDRAFT_26069 [[Candida] arabinofermentans NRRL YB-2248]
MLRRTVAAACKSKSLQTCFSRSYRVTPHLFNVTTDKSIQATLARLPTLAQSGNVQYDKIINQHHDFISETSDKNEIDQMYDLSNELLKLIITDQSLSSEQKNKYLNLLIEKFTKFDYSVFATVSRKLDMSNLSLESIIEVIKYNPGRVNSSWELFKKFKGTPANDELHIQVLKKLINGDKMEIQDGNVALDLNKAKSVLEVYLLLKDKSLLDDATKKRFITEFIKLDLAKAITIIETSSELIEEILNESKDLKNSDHFYLYASLKEEERQLSASLLKKLLNPISNLQMVKLEESENFKALLEGQPLYLGDHTPASSTQEIIDQITKLETDQDDQSTRKDILKSLGFHSRDMEGAIEKFDKFQTKVPESSRELNELRSIASLIFVHECIESNKSDLLQFAEVLIPQSPLPPASNLASLILYHGWFGNGEKALDIYNKSLNLFMSKPGESSEEKNVFIEKEDAESRGKLIHALVLSTLLTGDLELAQFIKSKCKENNLLDSPSEIRMNESFKAYGELVENSKSDMVLIREGMRKAMLQSIREMAP